MYFRILISFLSKMEIQSSSHSWSSYISEALRRPSQMCALFAWMMRLLDDGMFPVFVAFIVALLGNCTVVPL